MKKIKLPFKKEDANKPHKCPVCGVTEFPYHGSDEKCDTCGWWDDIVQEVYPDSSAGENICCLNDARENYKKYGTARKPKGENK